MIRGITVPGVFRSMGITPTREVAWAVGTKVANQYRDRFGCQPPKDNRPKSSGTGSHCFAIYPPSWERRIRATIAEAVEAEQSQMALL